MQLMYNVYLYLILVICFHVISSWHQWDYLTKFSSTSATDAVNKKAAWESVWESLISRSNRYQSAPRPRRGHSLHLITTDPASQYNGDTYVVLFGGRDNDQQTVHIPKTYNVVTKNGTISFSTYDKKPVNPCDDTTGQYYSASERSGCATNSSLIDIGLIYNDVWAYKVCSVSEGQRKWDGPCIETGWDLWHPGAPQGGCTIELGIEVCTVPSERYNHASTMFEDGCLYVYGGFSERCGDYCDDIWFFDIYKGGWRQVYESGKLTRFYNDTFQGQTIFLSTEDVPIDNSTSKFAGPGARWRHTMAASDPYIDPVDGLKKQQFALYGGFRLWQGFSIENSQYNNWDIYNTRPLGGYLADLWIYTKYLDTTFPGQSFRSSNGLWKIRTAKQQCYSNPGLSWSERNDIACEKIIPTGRAGHGSVFDSARQYIWIFGGFTTYFPYLHTDGIGSGAGVSSVGSGGFVPYPGYQYFRNDLWFYDLNQSLWVEITYPSGMAVPDPRVDMVFLLLGDVLFVHGGFADNYIYDDTWYFNITSLLWLEKTKFVHPIYPSNCTDDFIYISEHNCTELLWPKHLARDQYYPFDIVPYSSQSYYWPNPEHGPYYGIFHKDYDSSEDYQDKGIKWSQLPAEGTPEFPFAATGPMQYARPFFYSFNYTHNATLYEYCTSVYAEPTRGRNNLNGLYGRANGSIFIPQPRPQKPGWDGCRDRYDGRTDLPSGLQYELPLPRYDHRAVFISNTSEIIMYGGMAYTLQQPKTYTNTWPSTVSSEMWYFNLFHCINNCSSNGNCYYGFCQCYDGYYGEDCSNISCPGTFCYYDPITFEQICKHACQAGHIHKDADNYVQDIAKIPCSLNHPGESNGICDGFGTSMCAPPFVGNDCGTKDCQSNCSFNGWCSIEYPVSRCMCQPGYFGNVCQFKICLNNCSYPNGVCNITSGSCNCRMMYSPYNNTRPYEPWGGEDCSYLFPYAAAVSFRYASLPIEWFKNLVESAYHHHVHQLYPTPYEHFSYKYLHYLIFIVSFAYFNMF